MVSFALHVAAVSNLPFFFSKFQTFLSGYSYIHGFVCLACGVCLYLSLMMFHGFVTEGFVFCCLVVCL